MAKRARAGAHEDHRGVHVAGFGEPRFDHDAGHRAHRHHLFARHKARHVEVVDGHVAEQPARFDDEFHRRQAAVAAGHDDHLDRTHLAGAHRVIDGAVVGIVTAVEADLDRYAQSRELGAGVLDPFEVEVDRLLAQHRLAGAGRGRHQIDMGGRGCGDQHRVHGALGERGLDIGRRPRAQPLGQRPRLLFAHVIDADQVRPRVGGQVQPMQHADAPGPEQRESHHRPASCAHPGTKGTGRRRAVFSAPRR